MTGRTTTPLVRLSTALVVAANPRWRRPRGLVEQPGDAPPRLAAASVSVDGDDAGKGSVAGLAFRQSCRLLSTQRSAGWRPRPPPPARHTASSSRVASFLSMRTSASCPSARSSAASEPSRLSSCLRASSSRAPRGEDRGRAMTIQCCRRSSSSGPNSRSRAGCASALHP